MSGRCSFSSVKPTWTLRCPSRVIGQDPNMSGPSWHCPPEGNSGGLLGSETCPTYFQTKQVVEAGSTPRHPWSKARRSCMSRTATRSYASSSWLRRSGSMSVHIFGVSLAVSFPLLLIPPPPNMLSIFPDTTVRFHSGIRGMCYLSEAQRGEVTPREFIVY